jgi:hypothetical protein
LRGFLAFAEAAGILGSFLMLGISRPADGAFAEPEDEDFR